jgi:hypothetical protein
VFDTYRVSSGPRTVHEHRAPTDDAIRLAREYEDRAMARVLEVLTPQPGNTFTASAVRLADGKKYRVKSLTVDALSVLTGDEGISRLRDELAKEIDTQIVCDNLPEWRTR